MHDDPNADDALFAEIKDVLQSSAVTNANHLTVLPPIENFQIVRELHRGGQGIVYEAMQQNPQRRVALKVLLHGNFSSARQRLRFDREVQWIAGLNHPNIVTVYDSGFVDGQPFYAMEFVEGSALNHDVRFRRPDNGSPRQAQLHVRRTLEVLETICGAVTCFQQHGLIHRDLKPDNILVDESGHPHVVDFGLAREMDGGDDDAISARLQTRSGEFLGTLAYASPEQLSGRPETVDARTDVYALGVILYELLVGALPHDSSDSTVIVIQRVCNEDPVRPFLRNSAIDRDVETIVLKALSRDPERRYQSAAQLAGDLRRYLGGLPIDARRNSTWYILRKTVRRHWVATAVAIAFMAVLTTSSATSFVLWRRAEKRLDRAVQAEANAETAWAAEVRQRKEAEFRGSAASMAAALAAIRDYRIHDAHDHLHRIPRRLRGYEWHYAISCTDNSIDTWDFGPGFQFLKQNHDGRRIVIGGQSGSIRVVDVATGQSVFAMDEIGNVTAVALHPGGRKLVAGFEDGQINEVDLATKEWKRISKPMPSSVAHIAISPDGTRLIATAGIYPSPKFLFTIRDYDTGSVVAEKKLRVHAVDVNPDSSRVAAVGDAVTIFDAMTGQVTAASGELSDWHNHVKYSSDGDWLVTASSDQTVAIFDPESATEKNRFPVQRATTRGLAVDPDGQMIATSATDGTVRLWDADTGTPTKVFWGHTSWAGDVVFANQGDRLISVDDKTGLKVWNPVADVGDFRTKTHSSTVYDVQYNSTGTVVATCSFSSTIRLWDVPSGKRLKTFSEHSAAVNDIDISADDCWLASASSDKTVRIHDMAGATSKRLKELPDEALCVTFSPNGKLLAAGAKDGTIRVWNVETRKQTVLVTSDAAAPIRWLRFLPTGKQLVAEQPAAFEIRDASSGELIRRWAKPRNSWFAAAALNPDGTQVAAGEDSGRIQVWSVHTGESVAQFAWHQMAISALTFNPSGSRLAAASQDGAAKIWHVTRQAELMTLPSAQQIVYCLDFSPDGKRLAGGHFDGQMTWWEAIAPAERLGNRF